MKFRDERTGISAEAHTPTGEKFLALFAGIVAEQERDESEWVKWLREQGVKAAHPDDGWVDRAENSVHFCYPQFCDSPKEGDKIALGWPDRFRIVTVEKVRYNRFGMPRFHFSGDDDRHTREEV